MTDTEHRTASGSNEEVLRMNLLQQDLSVCTIIAEALMIPTLMMLNAKLLKVC